MKNILTTIGAILIAIVVIILTLGGGIVFVIGLYGTIAAAIGVGTIALMTGILLQIIGFVSLMIGAAIIQYM